MVELSGEVTCRYQYPGGVSGTLVPFQEQNSVNRCCTGLMEECIRHRSRTALFLTLRVFLLFSYLEFE
jgi:hypothetical protein